MTLLFAQQKVNSKILDMIKSTDLQILDRQDQVFNQGQMNRKAGPKRRDISIFI